MQHFLAILLVIALAVGCSPTPREERLPQIIEQIRPSILFFRTNLGSCTAWAAELDLIVTAAHCLTAAQQYELIDSHGHTYEPKLILADKKRDIAIFHVPDFDGRPLPLWNERLYGELKMGESIMSVGFPGYIDTNFIFELNYFNFETEDQGIKKIISQNIALPGLSGGCVISMRTGHVIGLTQGIAERIIALDSKTHTHKSISVLISYKEINSMLEKAKARKLTKK